MGFFFMGIIIFTVLFLILWNRGKAGMATLSISFGAKKRRTVDISDQLSPLQPEWKPAVDTLSTLGFSRLGEVQVKIPGGQTAKSRMFISADKKVFAELTETESNIVVFTSVFPDDAVVETGFPVGENIETAGFRSHTITTDLEKACLHQVQQVEAFGKVHGVPRKINNMQEYLVWDAMYRKRYVSRKMRRHTWLGFLEVLALGYGFTALLVALFYWLGSDKSTIEPLIIILFLLLIALAPAAITAFMIPYIGDRGSRREAKSA